ncbi:hypothetical protein HBH69_202490 [Parastagonospora nodorum]|nr:hypothetical protein HBH42_030220 [Parastagonospora nodorum]KAH4897779.1 hypothetical protein HBH74_189570 [Parastagonospora nodorum]KAH4983132.1 hypothetical protein HBH73_033100 [Parastagonospora nodorum]KAH5142280.1 hypothetical protein HBH69_202490 [Parastagonospora nodorum]KAH5207912.1 hypothetical protein HBH68_084670 [Parastagonospora nodorum]
MEPIRKVSGQSDTQPLSSPISPFEDVETAYDSGDLGMQYNDASNYSPLATPDSVIEARRGSYTYLNTPTSTFETDQNSDKESLVGDQFQSHRGHHVKRFDHNESRMKLLRIGGSKLLITMLFSALMCVCLRSWEGFRHQHTVLSKIDVRIFNAIMIGLSLCLGLNLLSSLKHYANTFRWSFLARRYVSLETFDLILHASSLVKVTKLMIISMPGIRRQKHLHKLPWFKDARNDGTKWMWLVCALWLSINIGSQVLVALLSLFWPVENSFTPLMSPGNVTVADLTTWYVGPKAKTNATAMETAWQFGMEAQVYFEYPINETMTDLSSLPGTPLYHNGTLWEYRFFNRNPQQQYTSYILSERKIHASTTCEQLQVDGNVRTDEDGILFIKGKADGQDWTMYNIPEQAAGSITWMASVDAHCGSRCTNFTILQNKDKANIPGSSLFMCNSTLSHVTPAHGKYDISGLTHDDEKSVYGSDAFARIAAGAIGWTGIAWNDWKTLQSRTYTQGSEWSPTTVVTTDDVARMLSRFTIGAVAAFDDHGIRYDVRNQQTVPTQGQQLDVDWFWIIVILSSICGIQLTALILMVAFANRAIVRDESFFSMAMLLSPVVSKIGRSGMNLSGAEIKEHRKLMWKKIRYDYREGKDGGPNRVDIFFEGKDQREGRKSWAPGSYS